MLIKHKTNSALITFFLLVVIRCMPYNAIAQDYYFRQLSTTDGLSQSSVISIAQDKKGMLWFATRDGLNIYDGYSFTVFKNKKKDSTTISNNDILELLVDSEGDVWAGTYYGLNQYDYKKNRFHRYYNDANDSTSLSNNTVWALCQMHDGTIWVGTSEGLNIYKDGNFKRLFNEADRKNSLSGNHILDIFQDSDKDIWIATTAGLNKLIKKENGQYYFERFNTENTSKITNNTFQVINEDPNGSIWAGTKGGLLSYSKSNDVWNTYQNIPDDDKSLSDDDVRAISVDTEGQLWVGTYNGLNKKLKNNEFQRIQHNINYSNSLTKNTIKSTFIDKNGSLWIGIYYGGVNMLDKANNTFSNYKQLPADKGLSYDVVSSITEGVNNKIYVGTEGGGINILETKSGNIRQLKIDKKSSSIKNDNIKGLYLENDRQLWVGTLDAGLYLIDLEKERIVQTFNKKNGLNHNSIYSILKENDSIYWIGTFGGGLNLLNIKAKTSRTFTHNRFNENSITNNYVRSITKDSDSNIWIATQYGLNKLSYSLNGKEVFKFESYFYNKEKDTGEDILAVFEDCSGTIWVGTYNNGLSKYNKKNKVFESQQGLMPEESRSNIVHGILEDKSHQLWLSTNKGLVKYNPTKHSLTIFDESDGIISNEFNNNAAFKSKDGRMYFGGPQGLTAFYPDKIKMNTYAPKTVLTDFKLFNQQVKVNGKYNILDKVISEKEQITLDYDQTIFTLEFAIPNYINPDKNFYRYRLKGLEENWNETYKNSATYTIQRPGNYTFEVQGANNAGIWSEEINTLAIKILPAPWRTWWAFACYALIIVFALYALTNIIISRSKLRHELDLEHIENEKQKSINQLKLKFFTNISHEFRTPLTLILGPLEQILADYKGSNKTFKQLKVIEKNAMRLLKLINQLLDFRKFENKHEKIKAAEGNIVKFVEEIFLSFKHYSKLHGLAYSYEKEQETIALWYDRDKMERVFYNLISNAFKFTPKGGNIKLKTWCNHTNFFFEITDSGIGIDQKHLTNIFDRFYEVERENEAGRKLQKGTGIGLAIAKGVIDLHNGTIEANSEKNKGTTFKLSIPLGKEHLNKEQIIQDFKDSEDLSSYLKVNEDLLTTDNTSDPANFININDENIDKPTILIVDDNNSVREFIADMFSDNYNICQAENGIKGLQMANKNVPDLIISDVMMPEMDGIEFCAKMKSNIKTSHIPFILLTARTSLIFKFEGLESGADEYISKPFSLKELQLKSRNLINAYRKIRDKFSQEAIVKPSEITVTSLDEDLLKKAIEIVDINISNEFFDVPFFASELGVSRTVLFTKVKAWTNMTPNAFITSMRMKRAASLLEQGKISVSQVCFKVGYKDPKYFGKAFLKHHGMSPSAYSKKFTAAN